MALTSWCVNQKLEIRIKENVIGRIDHQLTFLPSKTTSSQIDKL